MYTLEIIKFNKSTKDTICERSIYNNYYIAFETAKMKVSYNEQAVATIIDKENKVIACISNIKGAD